LTEEIAVRLVAALERIADRLDLIEQIISREPGEEPKTMMTQDGTVFQIR